MKGITVSGGINTDAYSYEIVWADDFSGLAEAVRRIPGIHPGKICIVTDSNVGPLYLNAVSAALSELSGVQILSWQFPAGEENKNLSTIQDLYGFLVRNHFERGSMIAALGGGVAGDMAGFAAATYMRGIDFIQIPSSLLAQVDSSVGGKTGVDFEEFKNMIGAFHQPRLVYMNMDMLGTLPEEQFISGMGEVVKSAEIMDADFFDWLEKNSEGIKYGRKDLLAYMVRKCCEIKAAVVEEDPQEKGIRAILNFGHTIGHAVEKSRNFELLHGQCVGAGIIAASALSMKKGFLSEDEYQRIVRMNRTFGLPVSVRDVTPSRIVDAAASDKKMENGSIRFILLNGIGHAFISRDVTKEDLLAAAGVITETSA